MKFADKKKAYQQMQDPAHLCCDHELLTQKAPKSPALHTGVVDKVKAQREILWALLDVATVKEIESYRNPAKKNSGFIEKLVAIITSPAPETMAELKLADDEVCELLDQLEADGVELTDDQKDLVSAYKGLLSAAMVEIRKKEAENELVALDLQDTAQPKLASIARILKIETEDYKKATLLPLLDAYRLNLPKVSEGSGEEMIPVEAHLEVVNELTEENEQLKDELEAKEAETEDLQEQLEDAEAEKELLEEQLEEEKKSEAGPDPA